MQTIPETEIDQLLGKPSFWAPKQLAGQITYLHGIAAFDEVKNAAPSDTPSILNFKMRPNGLEVSMMHRFKMHRVGIPLSEIQAIELATPGQIVTKKEKSVVGRALLGGLLLGPVGALVGGLSGAQDATTTKHATSLLTLLVKQVDGEHYFVASVEPKDNEVVSKFLQQNLGQFVKA